MQSHPNACLTQKGSLRLATQHLEHERSLSELAAENGISLRCACRWLARYRSGGPTSLADRRSVRPTQRRTLDPQQLQQAVDLCHQQRTHGSERCPNDGQVPRTRRNTAEARPVHITLLGPLRGVNRRQGEPKTRKPRKGMDVKLQTCKQTMTSKS